MSNLEKKTPPVTLQKSDTVGMDRRKFIGTGSSALVLTALAQARGQDIVPS